MAKAKIVDWSKVLNVAENATFIQTCYQEVWVTNNQRPNITNFFPEYYTEVLWSYLNEKYEVGSDDALVCQEVNFASEGSTDLTVSANYFLKITDGLYITFVEFEHDETEGLVTVGAGTQIIYLPSADKEAILELISVLAQGKFQPAEASRFFMLSAAGSNYKLAPIPVQDVKLDFNLHYAPDFKEKSAKILRALRKGNKGLYLLHGEHGTGISTYIRYIAQQLHKNKSIIYVPFYMLTYVNAPDFMAFMRTQSNSILILENAEPLIGKRTGYFNDQAIANIKALADGLINDVFSVQVIVTFHADTHNVDDSILTARSIVEQHEFTKLPIAVANKLAKKVKKNEVYSEPKTLAEVMRGSVAYNKHKTIGYK